MALANGFGKKKIGLESGKILQSIEDMDIQRPTQEPNVGTIYTCRDFPQTDITWKF